jgi:hypothetical protein
VVRSAGQRHRRRDLVERRDATGALVRGPTRHVVAFPTARSFFRGNAVLGHAPDVDDSLFTAYAERSPAIAIDAVDVPTALDELPRAATGSTSTSRSTTPERAGSWRRSKRAAPRR